MTPSSLVIDRQPGLADGTMVLAFSGWMDGGDASTGSVEWITRSLGAQQVARIEPEGFYIYNFPGSMEISALFRPHTHIQDGVIREYEPPENALYCSERHNLVLFRGKEPNFAWDRFADCLFSFAAQSGISTVYFIGSVGGTVPHTREPRLFSTVSDDVLKPALAQYGVRFTNYEGPASFSTQLLVEAPARGLRMASVVAEIPAYIQGTNPKSIEAMVRQLSAMLDLKTDLSDLRQLASDWEERLNDALEEKPDLALNDALEEKPDLAEHILKLEEDYDNEVFDSQMGDLKQWLEQRGIQVD
jgi:predicted ATP-grasp superfamily ATP-dependent carboligase